MSLRRRFATWLCPDLEQERATYKHAFETTRADRARILNQYSPMAAPLDVGYFRMDFDRLRERPASESAALAERLEGMFARGAYTELMMAMLEAFPVRIAVTVEEAYFRPFATYYMANLCAVRRDFEGAERYAEMIEFSAPHDGADYLPYDLRQTTRIAEWRQERALENGAPSVILISLMKSASAYFSYALGEALKVPVLRFSVGEGLHSFPVPKWVRQIARGGAVTHEHMEARPQHLAILTKAGVREVWIQIRDPRDCAYSLMVMKRSPGAEAASDLDCLFVSLTKMLAEWVDGWIAAAEAAGSGLDVRFIHHREIAADLTSTIRRITNLGDDAAQNSNDLPSAPPNFRKGTGGEWRALSQDVQDRAWAGIPERVWRFMELDRH